MSYPNYMDHGDGVITISGKNATVVFNENNINVLEFEQITENFQLKKYQLVELKNYIEYVINNME